MRYYSKPIHTVVVGGPKRRRGYKVVREDGTTFRTYLGKDYGGIDAARKAAELQCSHLNAGYVRETL